MDYNGDDDGMQNTKDNNDHHLADDDDDKRDAKMESASGTADNDEPGPSSKKRARTSLDARGFDTVTQFDDDVLPSLPPPPPPPSLHHHPNHHHYHHDGHHQDDGPSSPSPSPSPSPLQSPSPSPSPSPNLTAASSSGWHLRRNGDGSSTIKTKTLLPAEKSLLSVDRRIGTSERRQEEDEEEEKEEEEVEKEDLFARLPDSLLLKILDDVQDVKMIFRCSVLCRRLRALVWKVSVLAFHSQVCCNMMMMNLVLGATELSSLHIQRMTQNPSRCGAGHTSLPPSLTVFELDPSVIHALYFGSSIDVWLLHSPRLTKFSINFPAGVCDSLLERILTVCVMHCHNLQSLFINCGLALQQICSHALLDCKPSESVRTLYLRGVFHLATTTTPQISLAPLAAAVVTADASPDRVEFLLRLFANLEDLELHPQDMRIPAVRSSTLRRLVIISGQFASNSRSTIVVQCQGLQDLHLANFADIDLQLQLEGSGSSTNSVPEMGTLAIESVSFQGLMSRVQGEWHTAESFLKLCNIKHLAVSSAKPELRSWTFNDLKEAVLDKETILWVLQHSQGTLETCIWDLDIGCCDPYSMTHGWSCSDPDYHRNNTHADVRWEERNLNERPGEGGWGDGWAWGDGWPRGGWGNVGNEGEGGQRNDRGRWGQVDEIPVLYNAAPSGRIPLCRGAGSGDGRVGLGDGRAAGLGDGRAGLGDGRAGLGDGRAALGDGRDGWAVLGGRYGWANDGWGNDGGVQEGRRNGWGWGGEDRNYDPFHRARRDRRNLRGNRGRERRNGWGRQYDLNRNENYWQGGGGGGQDFLDRHEHRNGVRADGHHNHAGRGSNAAADRFYKFCKGCSKSLWRDLTSSVELKALRCFEIRRPSVVRGWEDFVAASSAVGNGQESICCPHGPSSSSSSAAAAAAAAAGSTVEPSLVGFRFAPKLEVLKLFVDEVTTRTLALIDRLSHDCTSLTTLTVKTRSSAISTPIVSQLLNLQVCPAVKTKIVVENGW
ncbi:hypothetical protein CBR_g66632 [Chara braunii]|uniref:F-box domain-containing protein n=1 Tax=Chara braunii TaxID=69332 RepID=A0A388MFQ8_CHABU|nr:hypothetical protein CBR_g66632 [Chara braunii]|eukprot:GBG93363.1 hypothetical protein CBR_g66632 [Chara braunii]